MSLNYMHVESMQEAKLDRNCRYHPFKEESQILSFSELIEVKGTKQKISSNLERNCAMQVILGEKGIGKTMLLRNVALSRRLNSQIINGTNGLTVVNLFKTLSEAIGAPLGSLTAAPMKHINYFVENFCKQERPLCIMLDNAERLPLQTLAALIHCNNKILQEGREDFTVALFGNQELKNKISPLISDDDKLETDFHELKRLSEESIVHYIYTKLRHAGWKGALPIIAPQELRRIKQNSSGVPKNINHVVGHHYFDEWTKNWQQGANRSLSPQIEIQNFGAKIASLLALTAIIAWLMITPSMAIYKGGWSNLSTWYLNTSNNIIDSASSLIS